MVKNIKVLSSAHQAMSVRAATLGVQKYELSTALCLLALNLSDEQLLAQVREIRDNLKTEYPNLELGQEFPPDEP